MLKKIALPFSPGKVVCETLNKKKVAKCFLVVQLFAIFLFWLLRFQVVALCLQRPRWGQTNVCSCSCDARVSGSELWLRPLKDMAIHAMSERRCFQVARSLFWTYHSAQCRGFLFGQWFFGLFPRYVIIGFARPRFNLPFNCAGSGSTAALEPRANRLEPFSNLEVRVSCFIMRTIISCVSLESMNKKAN